MDLQPRARFLENKEFASFHQELVVSTKFRAAAEAALLQTLFNTPPADSESEAAACWHRVEGAKQFLNTFMNLAENPKLLPPKPNQNLDHSTR